MFEGDLGEMIAESATIVHSGTEGNLRRQRAVENEHRQPQLVTLPDERTSAATLRASPPKLPWSPARMVNFKPAAASAFSVASSTAHSAARCRLADGHSDRRNHRYPHAIWQIAIASASGHRGFRLSLWPSARRHLAARVRRRRRALKALAAAGLKFTILAGDQAASVARRGASQRWSVHLQRDELRLAVFRFDRALSAEISSVPLMDDGRAFGDHLAEVASNIRRGARCSSRPMARPSVIIKKAALPSSRG